MSDFENELSKIRINQMDEKALSSQNSVEKTTQDQLQDTDCKYIETPDIDDAELRDEIIFERPDNTHKV